MDAVLQLPAVPIKVLGIIEFRHVPHREVLLETEDINEENLLIYLGLLCFLVISFSILGIEMLRQKARHLF